MTLRKKDTLPLSKNKKIKKRTWKKKIAILFLLILVASTIFVVYENMNGENAVQSAMKGNHTVLLLCADSTENTPGIGAVDMAFIINTTDGDITNITSLYPHGMAHPNATVPEYLQSQGVNKLYLHDSLWNNDTESGMELAKEIVEYNTGYKPDVVVVMDNVAVDALINSIEPLYVNGVYVSETSENATVNGSSLSFIRTEQYSDGEYRGDAVKSLMTGILNATEDPTKFSALLNTATSQYSEGNIVVEPKSVFLKIVIAAGLKSLI